MTVVTVGCRDRERGTMSVERDPRGADGDTAEEKGLGEVTPRMAAMERRYLRYLDEWKLKYNEVESRNRKNKKEMKETLRYVGKMAQMLHSGNKRMVGNARKKKEGLLQMLEPSKEVKVLLGEHDRYLDDRWPKKKTLPGNWQIWNTKPGSFSYDITYSVREYMPATLGYETMWYLFMVPNTNENYKNKRWGCARRMHTVFKGERRCAKTGWQICHGLPN